MEGLNSGPPNANPSSGSEEDLNPRPPDLKSSTQPLSHAASSMWVEFVFGSRPCSEGFSPGSPIFLPPQKLTLLNSNLIGNPRATGLSLASLLRATLFGRAGFGLFIKKSSLAFLSGFCPNQSPFSNCFLYINRRVFHGLRRLNCLSGSFCTLEKRTCFQIIAF